MRREGTVRANEEAVAERCGGWKLERKAGSLGRGALGMSEEAGSENGGKLRMSEDGGAEQAESLGRAAHVESESISRSRGSEHGRQIIGRALARVLLVMLVGLLVASPADAASYELSATSQKLLDGVIAKASQGDATRLRSLHNGLLSLHKQELEWEQKAKNVQFAREEAEIAVRKQMSEIGSARIAKLTTEVANLKKRYEPVFAMKDEVAKQLSWAKSAKQSVLVKMLQFQSDNAKLAVQIAKQDIKSKEESLKAAKQEATAAKARVRNTLNEMNPLKVQIRAKRSAISTLNRQYTSEMRVLVQALKKGEATPIMTSLSALDKHYRQIVAHRKEIHELESKISAIVSKAKSLIPK